MLVLVLISLITIFSYGIGIVAASSSGDNNYTNGSTCNGSNNTQIISTNNIKLTQNNILP